jgi:hypothetical protein
MLQKDDVEHSVPHPLRSKFREIAEAFVAGDYQLRDHPVAGVRPVEADTAKWIAECISAYGDDLELLSEQTWERSIYRWMDGYWMALVDLTTRSEPVSDLSLHAKLYEGGDVEIYGVFVP